MFGGLDRIMVDSVCGSPGVLERLGADDADGGSLLSRA